MKILNKLWKSPVKIAAGHLYDTIVNQARHPRFYLQYGVPDTVDGRFDMILLHAFIVLHRLKKNRGQTAKLAQELFDLMFADMDQNLRELGVGDLSVGPKIRKMTSAFNGRIVAYENSLNDSLALAEAIDRNVFRHVDSVPENLKEFVRYIQNQISFLDAQPIEKLLAGELKFESISETNEPIQQGLDK